MYAKIHYLGFLHACKECGIEKSAADRLYKSAGFFSGLGKFLGGTTNVAAKTTKGIARGTGRAARATGHGIARGYRAVKTPIVNAANAVGEAAVNAGRDIRSGYRAVRPLTPAQQNAINAKRLAKVVAVSPWRMTKNFIMKHPVISTGIGIAGGSYLTNMANQASLAESQAQLPTMTPSERLMFDRASDGLNLPGLGLDPVLFQGEGLPSYL